MNLKKFNNKYFLITIFLIVISSLTTACGRFPLPEELLVAPEINIEKKEMKEAIEKFKPDNTVSYPVLDVNDRKQVSMTLNDLNGDGHGELVCFFKSRETEKIGLMILTKSQNQWIKKTETFFDFSELSQFRIIDLNNDNKKEIVIEAYFYDGQENKKSFIIGYVDQDENIKFLDKISCYALAVGQLQNKENSDYYITIASKNKIGNGCDVKVLKFTGKNLGVIATKYYLEKMEPFNIVIGNLYKDKKAIFINYFENSVDSDTAILLMDINHQSLYDIKQENGLDTTKIGFNINSKDIDNDSIIEVGYKFIPPNYKTPVKSKLNDDGVEINMPYVKGYFKINPNRTLDLVSEIYEDYNVGYSIDFPESFKGKYAIEYSGDNIDLNNPAIKNLIISYVTHSGNKVPLIEIHTIKRLKWEQDEELRKKMQFIAQNDEYIIAGDVKDNSEMLSGEDKRQYLEMRSDVLVLSNIVKQPN